MKNIIKVINVFFYVLIAVLGNVAVGAEEPIVSYEKESLDSTEGWAMAHTLSSALNLGSAPAEDLGLWNWRIETEVASIPHLSREEQRVGFSGYKLEDMNKSPVFGRARLHIGLPSAFKVELSWTPPIEINGAKPVNLYGIAIERMLLQRGLWQLGARLYSVRGDAIGDITCSERVASFTPGSRDNPYGCAAPSKDRLRMDQEGIELMLSRSLANGRWQPFLAYANTRLHPYAKVEARIYNSIEVSELTSKGNTDTFSIGTSFTPSQNWRISTAFSYTPLEVRRLPLKETGKGDFWSGRLALAWRPER